MVSLDIPSLTIFPSLVLLFLVGDRCWASLKDLPAALIFSPPACSISLPLIS